MIESTTNQRIKRIKKLQTSKERRGLGRTILEGPNGLEALISSGIQPVELLALPGDEAAKRYATVRGVDLTVVSVEVMRSVSDTKNTSGPVAVIDIPPPKMLRRQDTVALVDISDPGNVGTMVRTAAAFGWDVAVYGSTADVWSPKAVRASAATMLSSHLSFGTDPVADAQNLGLMTAALVVSGAEPPRARDDATMLLVGSEAHGLATDIVSRCDVRITLPMVEGSESLNAAIAAGVAMYSIRPDANTGL